ncbi:MAG TPA: glycoside hydrolase family 38 C-terminal domain-containing protein [Streptosporangiaceae bacterium]|nr:glycoside hydrolase family 38 C-terminal domain-containing protein [Streptosporangiaceae bacterium]
MRIAGVESTDLFVGTAQRPLQVIRVTVVNDGPGSTWDGAADVHVQGAGVRSQGPFRITGMSQTEQETFEVPVEFSVPYQPGSTRRVTVAVQTEAGRSEIEADVTAAEPGWTMWMVSHFHYDPVWWNTQGQFTEAKLSLPDENGNLPDMRSAFDLVGAHLDKARKDEDYKFVLAEVDYLKPYFDVYPQDRQDLRRLMAEGRVEIVGGNYNEPSTTLISAEAIIRNAVAGIGFQRDVFGGDPRVSWMLDVFGHDPGYPGLMAAAGLTSSAWARGPFHQWGPRGVEGGIGRMQFRTEFEWISPDGQGLLTHYMAHHYGAGWRLNSLPDLQAAEREAYGQFSALSRVAATRNVLLPVGVDHVIPARWVTDVHRSWNQRYVWPRFTTAVPSEFFAAVRADAGSGDRSGAWITPQTRDMNPVYTGKDVSYIDTKQGQRAIETAVLEAERLATVAWLAGAPFPHAALDKAWRMLAFGAHHDGITGVESDQVYLDMLGGWREAWELGSGARLEAVRYLTGPQAGPGRTVSVFNGLARPRDGLARITVQVPDDGTQWLEVRDASGEQVRCLAEGVRRRPDGSLAEVTLTLLVRGVPALGFRSYQLVPAGQADEAASGWREDASPARNTIENGSYVVTADPARGGTVSVTDKRLRAGVLTGPGNELVLQDEYAQHPKHNEGPWHLSPKGPGLGSSSVTARVRQERCPIGSRLVASFTLGGLDFTQEVLLWEDSDRVEFRTHVGGFDRHDQLLRVSFPADVPGGLPVYQTATAVIGRSFGVVDVDSADHWYTRDCAAQQWFGLSSAARVRTTGPSGQTEAVGVAEIVCPDDPDGLRAEVRDLVAALAAAGVTATCSQADGPRYGANDADSNLPDARIAVGGPDANAFTAEVLSGAGPGYAKALGARLAARAGGGTARLWVPADRSREDAFGPDPDLRGATDLPVLIVAGSGPGELAAAVAALTGDLSDALVDAGDRVEGDDAAEPAADTRSVPTRELADRSVAMLNRGTPGCVVTPDGTLHMSLMRSCSAWPSGIWIDGDRRTAPDGSSFAWQHWSHTFEYALASGVGDWRASGFAASAEDYNHDLIATVAGGPQPVAGVSLLEVEPATVTLSTLKPRGNPLASGRTPADGGDTVTIRLRETSGRATTARVRLAGAVAGVSQAWLTDLLEESDGAALPLTDPPDGCVNVDMPAFGTVTLVARTSPPVAPADRGTAPSTEPVEPIYARYWLHGKGPAPAGNVPVAIHFSPTRVALAGPGETATLTLTVACGSEPAAGTVELVTPDGLTVATGQDLRYELAPGGYAAWDVTVRADEIAAPGRYFVAARLRDGLGHLLEDTTMVAVGERRWPDPALPPEEALEVMQADYAATAAEVTVTMLTPELRVAPGGRGELEVSIANALACEVHGEAQLVSPFGTWDILGPRAQGFSVAPQASAVLRFDLSAPETVRPGARWWALVKVMYYGRVRYTEAIGVFVEAE